MSREALAGILVIVTLILGFSPWGFVTLGLGLVVIGWGDTPRRRSPNHPSLRKDIRR